VPPVGIPAHDGIEGSGEPGVPFVVPFLVAPLGCPATGGGDAAPAHSTAPDLNVLAGGSAARSTSRLVELHGHGPGASARSGSGAPSGSGALELGESAG